MIEHMILDDDHNVVPADLMTWARFFDDHEARTVAKTDVRGKHVSTVFLGIDHSFGGSPLWFETMVFPAEGDPNEEYTERYATWTAAEAGHARIVAALKEGREP